MQWDDNKKRRRRVGGQTHPSACSLPNASPQARGTSSFFDAFLVRTIDVRRRNTALDSQAGPAPPPSLLGTPRDPAVASDPSASEAKLGPAYVPQAPNMESIFVVALEL